MRRSVHATPRQLTYALRRPHLTILPLLSAVCVYIQEGTRFDVLVSKALETEAARKQYDKTRSEDDKKAFEEAYIHKYIHIYAPRPPTS